jgi:hypothetical protein
LEAVTVEQTDHYRIMREFCDDPVGFVEAAMEGIIIPLPRRSSAFHR